MSIRELADWEIKPVPSGGQGQGQQPTGRRYSDHQYQRVIVKAEYVDTKEKPNQLGKLTRYMEREGDCREKFLSPERGARYLTRDGGQLFGAAGEHRTANHELRTWDKEGRFWHIVVSPEASHRLSTDELRRFTGRLVAQWEKTLGHQLEYKASIHADSTRANGQEPQPHIHLLVRGTAIINGQRQLYRIPERTISHTFRGNARELATRMWGMRTMADREKSWRDQVEAKRPTRLDLRLQEKMRGGAVAPERLDDKEKGRVAFLIREGHARYDITGKVRFEPNYTDRLRETQHNSDRMKERAREARELRDSGERGR